MKQRTIIWVLLVCIIMVMGVAPAPAMVFAAPTSGERATTAYENTLVGSDGNYYYRTGQQTSLQYLSNGSTKIFKHENFQGARKHYLIKTDNQGDYYGYCIEQGISYPDAMRYTGESWKNDKYFNALPKTVRQGIMLATIFGRQPGKTVPVAGCNNDDWYWATQVIIWEYQQKLRTSPTSIESNGYVPSNYFENTLHGRPAEKCYKYMLSAMSKYTKIPSFTSKTPEKAKTVLLKWDSKKSVWTTTVKDANKLNVSLIQKNKKVTVIKDGTDYTFQSKSKMSLTTLTFQKDTDLPSHELLIWGGKTSSQALVSGTADPIYFYMKLRTEEPGTLKLIKTSEDGKKAGFEFEIIDKKGIIKKGVTNKDGQVTMQLAPGTYQVTEVTTGKYREMKKTAIVVSENKTTNVAVYNELIKGKIQIIKSAKNLTNQQSYVEPEAVFQIFLEKYSNYESAPETYRDQVSTNEKGWCESKELPIGNYIIHQIEASPNTAFSTDKIVNISNDNKILSVAIENEIQRGKIKILKIENKKTGNSNNKLLSGASFEIRAAKDLFNPDGSQYMKKGTLVGKLATNQKGTAISDWLQPGEYNIIEKSAPSGYVLPKQPIVKVLLGTEDQTAKTFIQKVQIENSPIVVVPKTGDAGTHKHTMYFFYVTMVLLLGIVSSVYWSKQKDKILK